MTASRLVAGEVAAGTALPWDLCDEAGRLLLRRGFVIENPAQLQRMLEAGLHRRAPHEAAGNGPVRGHATTRQATIRSTTVFARIATILGALEALLGQASPAAFPEQVMQLATDVQQCFAHDPDAAIATIQVLQSGRHSIRRLVHAAILMELLLTHAGEPESGRRVALAAALTMNIAMLDVQDVLSRQPNPPDPAQRALLRQHPQAGVLRLRQLGVTDPLWLSTVEQHHETVDGKGYPLGLQGAAVGRHAQILSMVDRYGSMAIGRAYRAAVLPNVVLKRIFMDKQSVDPRLATLLVSAVGMYPPGSLVALSNGELAVVVRRTQVASQPLVYGLKTARGQRLEPPRRRLTSEPAHAITGLVASQQLGFELDPARLWGQQFELPQADVPLPSHR